ncbi:MAG TPA: hypothetical protein VFD13_08970 [Candidatus Kapabacteria bacterium]|nr:hypothetical protein [Candidatus Kapabacteria bacterium]
MLNSFDTKAFFRDDEVEQLRALGLWNASHTTPARLAFAGLMLAPIMQIVVRDSATTSAEFEMVEDYLRRMEGEFGLATMADTESIGTDMGLLPMLKGSWNDAHFMEARTLLAQSLTRLSERDADAVRNAISRAALAAARAGSPHMISLHMLDREEREMINQLIRELQLERSSEGLQLLGKSADA